MAGELDSGRVDLACPGCGHKNRKTVRWLKTHNEFICAGCGKVAIETSSFKKGFREVDAEIDSLTKTLKKGFNLKL
jgi:hypothetical protein